jgi:4-hydroxy-2-oxoheptanedioate aldolase
VGHKVLKSIKQFAKYLSHSTLPEIKDFNALRDTLCLKVFAKRYSGKRCPMPAATNQIKARMRAGEMQIGVWLGMANMVGTEIAGRAGYDWCMIDAEHGANDLFSIRDQLITLASVGCPGAVRVAENSAWQLKQVLDLGAQTVLVPMVETRAQAEAAARAVFYPPQGSRGMAAGVVRASGYGAEPDYASSANEQVCLMVQVESRAGVENIDAIAGVDGVDCVLIGPSDLAADMGLLDQPDSPELNEAMAHVMARTRAAGKTAGIFCLSEKDMPLYRDLGARFMAVASDISILSSGLRSQAQSVRQRLAVKD